MVDTTGTTVRRATISPAAVWMNSICAPLRWAIVLQGTRHPIRVRQLHDNNDRVERSGHVAPVTAGQRPERPAESPQCHCAPQAPTEPRIRNVHTPGGTDSGVDGKPTQFTASSVIASRSTTPATADTCRLTPSCPLWARQYPRCRRGSTSCRCFDRCVFPWPDSRRHHDPAAGRRRYT